MDEETISRGAELIQQFHCSSNVLSWVPLVQTWIAKGVNLALAESFTERCAQTTQSFLEKFDHGILDCMDLSRSLFKNSCSPLSVGATADADDFFSKFCNENARWETLGLFFTAASRATIDVTAFDPLYSSQHQLRSFQKLATYYSDVCLDISLSLDCMNDLQLILQYENFILHSFIHGDQSESESPVLRNVLTTQVINHGANSGM